MIIRGQSNLSLVFAMNDIRLLDKFCQQMEQSPFEHVPLRGLALAFFAIRKIGAGNIVIFIARATDPQGPAVLAQPSV